MSDDPIRDHMDGLRRDMGRLGALRRRRLLAEVEDHLREAAAGLEAAGVGPTEAARRAVSAFGSSQDLAGATTGPRIALSIALTIAGAALITAFAITDSHRARQPDQQAASRMSPAALILSLERGLSDDVVSARIGPPPEPFRRHERGPWMYVRVRCLDGPRCIRGQWEAQMLAAAYHVVAPAHGLRAETGAFTYSGRESLEALVANRGNSSGGPVHTLTPGRTNQLRFTPTRLRAGVLTAQITRGLRRAHLTPESITFDRVDGYLAPVIVAKAPYPGILIRHPPQWQDAVGREPNGFEGVYLQLDYQDGRPAMATAVASRTALAIIWMKPSLNPHLGNP